MPWAAFQRESAPTDWRVTKVWNNVTARKNYPMNWKSLHSVEPQLTGRPFSFWDIRRLNMVIMKQQRFPPRNIPLNWRAWVSPEVSKQSSYYSEWFHSQSVLRVNGFQYTVNNTHTHTHTTAGANPRQWVFTHHGLVCSLYCGQETDQVIRGLKLLNIEMRVFNFLLSVSLELWLADIETASVLMKLDSRCQ